MSVFDESAFEEASIVMLVAVFAMMLLKIVGLALLLTTIPVPVRTSPP